MTKMSSLEVTDLVYLDVAILSHKQYREEQKPL